jgi:hypothetical protein
MLRSHRLVTAIALALVTVALLAPVAQARTAFAGGVQAPATTQPARQSTGGIYRTVIIAATVGGTLMIAIGAGVGLVRRRTLAA